MEQLKQTKPTYTFSEFLDHLRICNADTLLVLIELLAEEVTLYSKIEATYLYANIKLHVDRFNKYSVINFWKLLK